MIFGLTFIIMGIARKLQSVVGSTSLITYRGLLGLKTELNKYEIHAKHWLALKTVLFKIN